MPDHREGRKISGLEESFGAAGLDARKVQKRIHELQQAEAVAMSQVDPATVLGRQVACGF